MLLSCYCNYFDSDGFCVPNSFILQNNKPPAFFIFRPGLIISTPACFFLKHNMSQLKIKLLLSFVILNHLSYSQFNDTTNYYANFAASGIVNKTNDRRAYTLSNNFRFSMYKKNVSVNTSHGFIFGKQQEQLINRDYSSSVDFNLFKTLNHFYYWGLGAYEKSYSLKINHRAQAGLGVGYHLLDRKNALVILSNGILYEKSDLFETAEVMDVKNEILRNSFRLKFRFLIHEIVTLEGTDFLQHSLSDRHDYIIRSMTSLSVKLMRWLAFTTSVTYKKIIVTELENMLINLGLTM
jgi:hypothetical protein